MIRTVVRTARKTHYCASCDRYRIRSGDRYLEGVVPPGAEPFCADGWSRLRECVHCAERYGRKSLEKESIVGQPNNIAATAKNWGAVYIEPGTPYADEPTETIPAGWYVMGIETDEGPNAVIHVEYAFDQDDNDTAKVIANAIADALTDAARATQSKY